MYLRAIGNSFTQNILKEISILTNQARVFFRDMEYDEAKGVIILPIERYKVLEKKRFFRVVITRKYEKSAMIQSTVIIRNVTNCHVENNIDDPNVLYVTLLFGITIRGDNIIISSLEEDRGKTCYLIKLKVSQIDIEIADNWGREIKAEEPDLEVGKIE